MKLKNNLIVDFLYKYHVFLLVLVLLIFKDLILNLYTNNETDVLPVAKHFMNHNWIPNDWYLNLGIGYRYFFNIFAGFMSTLMPLYMVAFFGRLIIILLYAYIIQEFSRIFKIKFYLILIFVVLWWKFQSIVADEWMIGQFDTKCFAYFFAMLSVIHLYKKNYLRMFLFSGFALSFHVLVGSYAASCLLLSFIINFRYFKNDIPAMLKSLPAFIAGGFLGLFALFQNIFENASYDKSFAGKIYVLIRVPHHTLPSAWHDKFWIIKLVVYSIIILAALIVFFKYHKYRIFGAFALSSLLFFAAGYIIFKLNLINLLKYYWFRFPDVILPFYGLLFFIIFVRKLINFIKGRINFNLMQGHIKNIFFAVQITVAVVILIYSFKTFSTQLKWILSSKPDKPFYISNLENELCDSYKWINKNTSKDSVFLAIPFNMLFYSVAERAIFVTFKDSPQSEKDIIEWYNRIKLCSDDKNLEFDKSKTRDDLSNNFYNLRIDTINKIIEKYKIDYLFTSNKNNYPYAAVYKNDKYTIYKIN